MRDDGLASDGQRAAEVRHDGLSLPTGAALPSVGARERFCFCLCFAPTCKHFSSTIWSSVSPRISFFLSADGDRCARRAEIDAACQVVRGMNLSLSLSRFLSFSVISLSCPAAVHLSEDIGNTQSVFFLGQFYVLDKLEINRTQKD